MIEATRYHDFSAGHRVAGHENKCANLHGHNYRIHFTLQAPELDEVGRVIDFSAIKILLCEWLEDHWDHKFLLWEHDDEGMGMIKFAHAEGIVKVPFNPTAENMARYLVEVIAPEQLAGTDIVLTKCRVEETRKCSATYEIER